MAFCGLGRGENVSSGSVVDHWESEAENWVRWARTPGHDAYWYYSPGFFEEIVPPAGKLTVEIGCGEGRVARDLAAHGHRVVGVDLSPTLVRAARTADPNGWYLVAHAGHLPLASGTADLVVAYNSLMDVEDMPGVVAEAGRILTEGGRLCVCVTHPIADAGYWSDGGAAFIITETYLDRRRFEGTFERSGLSMTFRGWCYPIHDYADAFERAGLVIERLREPAMSERVSVGSRSDRWQRIPMFLYIRGLKAPRT